MIDNYKSDTNFAQIYEQVEQGVPISLDSIQEEFLMFGSHLCITKTIWDKVMQQSLESPYAGLRSAQSTIQAIELYFYWGKMLMTTSLIV